MNKNLVQPVHSSMLIPGQNYILDHLFGKGVQVEFLGLEGKFVGVKIVQGFMKNPLAGKQWVKGATLEVSAKSAKFYEVQG